MAQIRRTIVSAAEWASLNANYGNGKVPIIGPYTTLTTATYPNHDIAQGNNTLGGGGLAQTGYLRLGGITVIGTVSGLPTTMP